MAVGYSPFHYLLLTRVSSLNRAVPYYIPSLLQVGVHITHGPRTQVDLPRTVGSGGDGL